MSTSFFLSAVTVSKVPLFDIVFIHGFGGSPVDSWTYADRRGQSVFWPRLLGEALPAANVSVVGYPTSRLGKMLGGNDMGILPAAAGVIDLLLSHSLGTRPIFFVSHSLGGIVVKAALRQCSDSSDPRKLQLLKSTQGIVFFGTPNSGTAMGNVCAMLPGLVGMQGNELARADSLLLDLGQWFRNYASADTVKVHAFYETEKLNGQLVVDAASANPALVGCDPVPLIENHVSMCKLPSEEHTAFVSVRSFIVSTCTAREIDVGRDYDDADQLVSMPKLREAYLRDLFVSSDLRHLVAQRIDERDLFVDPVIYHQNSKSRLTSLDEFLATLSDTEAAVISGSDRAGKSVLAKLIQTFLDERGRPTVRIDGRQILSADILSLVARVSKQQYGENIVLPTTTVIIDDFDECQLPDTVRERIVAELIRSFEALIVTSFTHAPSVLFAPSDRPDPDLFELSPIGDERLLELVGKWKRLGLPDDAPKDETLELATFELLLKVFLQTEIDKYPGTAISFLQLIDSSSGADINFSSYAACYETLTTLHITKVRPNWQNLDEAKNFISFVAFTAFSENHEPMLSDKQFGSCLEYYQNTYFSSIKELREVAVGGFLVEGADGGLRFKEEYEWYFLCARHAAKSLKSGPAYEEFVLECTTNIFRKQYANMVIFMAYFTDDNVILNLLLDVVDGLFSKAPYWTISDEQRAIMIGLTPSDQLAISSSTNTSENRIRLLREKVNSIIDDAESVVAQFTLPFINPEIGDSDYVQVIDLKTIDSASYLKSINALMRVHSVIGQILASRSGTFDAKTMLDCITRMVQASGRYISLNHAISAVLVHDRTKGLEEADRAFDNKTMSREEKFEKVERIFSFWSVFLSQAGLARYLSQEHAIRALKFLVGKYESADQYKKGHIPFNFTSVLIIASLYGGGKIDRELFEKAVEKYGENSALVRLLRVAVNFYAYYLPLNIQDKQWLGNKLAMPVRRIEAQRRKAVTASRQIAINVREKEKPTKK